MVWPWGHHDHIMIRDAHHGDIMVDPVHRGDAMKHHGHTIGTPWRHHLSTRAAKMDTPWTNHGRAMNAPW